MSGWLVADENSWSRFLRHTNSMVHRTPFILPMLYPSLTWRIPTIEKELFLTFDDGPVPGPTEFVLDVLTRLQAKATFFSIGDNIRRHPEIFRSLLGNNHAVGNHTYNHLNGWKAKTLQYVNNVEQCSTEIKSFRPVGHDTGPPLFRPPYGRITGKQIAALSDFKIIMWDVLSIDYSRIDGEKCLKNTIRATRNGSIIVFHDSYKAERNLTYALPRYVEHFSSLGYVFKSIS